MPANPQSLLPVTLIASDDFVALTDVQRNNFVAKLRYCEEIAGKADSAANASDSDLFDAIDDIELDALSLISGFSDDDTSVSPYKVHASWTFEADRQMLAQHVGPDIAGFLGASPIGLGASNDEIRA